VFRSAKVVWLIYRHRTIQAISSDYLQRPLYSNCLKWKLAINCY